MDQTRKSELESLAVTIHFRKLNCRQPARTSPVRRVVDRGRL